MSIQRFDLIGDIHGYGTTLVVLLEKLGYRQRAGIFRHPERKAIFLGDFVDRGPAQRQVIGIARSMVEAESAFAVMGNHEFNAIAYATQKPGTDGYLRAHVQNNVDQHRVFLDAYAARPDDYAEAIEWFKSLPLWLDLGNLRVIHACWDSHWINRLQNSQLTAELLFNACEKGTWQFYALETLLKGKEIPLKEGISFYDKDGNERHRIRVRWWDHSATTYQAAFMGPESARTHIPDDDIAGDHLVEYGHAEPPVMLGHYWFEGQPSALAHNIACLDYSVAKADGKLVAYRWDGEQILDNTKFVWVDRVD